MGKTILSEPKMKISASLLFLTGGESARLRRDAPFYAQTRPELNQYGYMQERNSRYPKLNLQAAPFDFDMVNNDLGFLKDDYGNMNDDFGYASSENDYYPLDITQGDNYGNSVQYQTFGRIDDSADEWIDDDDLLSTSSSRTYGSRDRTFDFLADEDEDEDLFNDALDLLTDAPQLIDDDEEDIEELENVMPTLNEIASQIETERIVDQALSYAQMLNQPDLDVNDIFDDEEDDEVEDDLLFAGDLFDDEEDEDENESVDDLINEIRILDLVDELDSRQL